MVGEVETWYSQKHQHLTQQAAIDRDITEWFKCRLPCLGSQNKQANENYTPEKTNRQRKKKAIPSAKNCVRFVLKTGTRKQNTISENRKCSKLQTIFLKP